MSFSWSAACATAASKAQALIMSGEVYVNGQKSDKAGTPVEDEAVVELRGQSLPLRQPRRPEA